MCVYFIPLSTKPGQLLIRFRRASKWIMQLLHHIVKKNPNIRHRDTFAVRSIQGLSCYLWCKFYGNECTETVPDRGKCVKLY